MMEKTGRVLLGVAMLLTILCSRGRVRTGFGKRTGAVQYWKAAAARAEKSGSRAAVQRRFQPVLRSTGCFDLTRWTRLGTGRARTENGYWLMDVLRPPEVAVGGFATSERSFNPGLAGTNGVEITVAGFTHRRRS